MHPFLFLGFIISVIDFKATSPPSMDYRTGPAIYPAGLDGIGRRFV
jgi:hypothetical protein